MSDESGVKVVSEIELVPIPKLSFADYNPRTISQMTLEKLANSLKRYGFVDPVIVNRRSEELGFEKNQIMPTIVGGHQRTRAAILLGIEDVPVVWVDLSPVQERELNIALNKIEADWEGQLLAETLRWIDDHGGDYTATGFDVAEYTRLIDAASVEIPDSFPDVGIPHIAGPTFVICPSCAYEFDPTIAKKSTGKGAEDDEFDGDEDGEPGPDEG